MLGRLNPGRQYFLDHSKHLKPYSIPRHHRLNNAAQHTSAGWPGLHAHRTLRSAPTSQTLAVRLLQWIAKQCRMLSTTSTDTTPKSRPSSKYPSPSGHPPPPKISPPLLRMIDDSFTELSSNRLVESRIDSLRSSPHSAHHFANGDSAGALALTLADTPQPQRALRVFMLAHKLGCNFRQNAYELVVQRLADKRCWHLVPPLVSFAKQSTGRVTSRLINWRARALVETRHYRDLDDIIPQFKEEKREPSRKTYHLLVTGHLRNADLEKAKDCLRWMEDSGFPIDASTHALIVSTYRQLGHNDAVQARAFEVLRDVGGKTATAILNGLIQLYLDARDSEGAMRVLSLFRKSKSSNDRPGPSDSAGGGGSKHQDAPDATFGASRSAEAHGPEPDVATFTMLIDHMSRQGDLARAVRMYHRLRDTGLRLDSAAVASVLRAHLAADDVGTAVSMMTAMCGHSTAARARLQKLWPHATKINPIVQDFSAVPLDALLFAVFMEGMLRIRGLHVMKPIVSAMGDLGIRPTEKMILIFLKHLSKQERMRPRETLRTLRALTTENVRPTLEHVHLALTSILRYEKRVIHGRGWQSTAIRFSRFRVDKTDLTRRTLLDRDRSLDPLAGFRIPKRHLNRLQFMPILETLTQQGVKPDRAAFALAMRHVAVSLADPDSAKRYLEVMRQRGIKPNEYHYSPLMEGLARAGDMRGALATMDEAIRAGIKPNVVMYTILIAGYARHGQADTALRVFYDMVGAGIKPDVGAVDAVASGYFAIHAHQNARLVLLRLWPYVKPVSDGLADMSLQQLAKALREVGPGHPALPVKELSPSEGLALRRAVRSLVILIKSLDSPKEQLKLERALKTTGRERWQARVQRLVTKASQELSALNDAASRE